MEAGIVIEDCPSVSSADVDESSGPACKSPFVFDINDMVSYGASGGRVRGKGSENDEIGGVGNRFAYGSNVGSGLAVLGIEESKGVIR